MKPSNLILNNDLENYKIRVESDTGDIVVDMAGVVASSETDSGTNNGGGAGCGGQGQGGSGTVGPEVSSSTGSEGPEVTVGVTEATTGGTEGTVGATTTSPGGGEGGSCDDLIVDRSGWSGTWQV